MDVYVHIYRGRGSKYPYILSTCFSHTPFAKNLELLLLKSFERPQMRFSQLKRNYQQYQLCMVIPVLLGSIQKIFGSKFSNFRKKKPFDWSNSLLHQMSKFLVEKNTSNIILTCCLIGMTAYCGSVSLTTISTVTRSELNTLECLILIHSTG